MVEAQQFVSSLLSETGQAEAFFCLALGFTLGLITGLIIVYDALTRA